MSAGAVESIPAGNFRVWLGEIKLAMSEGSNSDVPCGSCSACCRSSQFILVTDADITARSVIPSELLFSAPGLPAGNHVMGYDSRGHCPMFGETGCSIYEDRPQACRAYDCRIFTATDIDVGADGHDEIASRAQQWQFEMDAEGEIALAAVRAAAEYVTANASTLGLGYSATARALAAIELATKP
ncbi:MAG: YkgJ family cysteine cluster protein [Actinomycetota bacterium]|nr:YkgJ family cysteine cluster protein [Actinomycetota bacterium]MDP2288480.1 YkgJ family cysteine cluster protein [Actinomycetota bacterium]